MLARFQSRLAFQATDTAQQLMLLIQQTVYSWEGSINKFIVDDKGLLVLCVFGLFSDSSSQLSGDSVCAL